MTRQWVFLLLAAVVMLAALLYVGAAQPALEVGAAPADCRMQGAWVSTFAGGPWDTPLFMQETISPQDPAGNKLTYTLHMVNPDATFQIEPLAEADYLSDFVGEAVRTGRDTYHYSLIGYGVNDRLDNRGQIVYMLTISGTMTCAGEDHKTDDVYLAVYFAAQDADQDGYPDEGQEPFLCLGPGPFAAGSRVPPMGACVPTPLEE